jgi:hypothetical protein
MYPTSLKNQSPPYVTLDGKLGNKGSFGLEGNFVDPSKQKYTALLID